MTTEDEPNDAQLLAGELQQLANEGVRLNGIGEHLTQSLIKALLPADVVEQVEAEWRAWVRV